MNIIQLHERTRFWIDVVGSTRFEPTDIDNGLNTAIDQKVRESYDQNLPMNKSDSFQRVQRLRDELGPLVKKQTIQDGDLTVTGNIIDLSAVTRYGWLLAIRVQPIENGEWVDAKPMSYNRKNRNEDNPFRKVRTSPKRNAYYTEMDGGIEIIHAESTLYDAEIYYLAMPVTVNYGIEYTQVEQSFSTGDVVYAVTIANYWATDPITIGESFTFPTIPPAPSNMESGTVVFGYTNPDIRETTHEEIARRAAINCLMTAGQTEKAKLLREEIQAS